MKTKVLYIEDDAINALVLRKFLEGEYAITIAHSSAEALLLFEDHEFDLLITDYNLNGELNGQELLRLIREQYPDKHFPSIILTADSSITKELVEADFDACMTKPFEKAKMLQCIESLLASTETRP